MPKEIIYEGCVAGDTPSVSWKPETPDRASSYKAEKAPIRVSLADPEPGVTYFLDCRFELDGEPYDEGGASHVTTPIGVPYKVISLIPYSFLYPGGRDPYPQKVCYWMILSAGVEVMLGGLSTSYLAADIRGVQEGRDADFSLASARLLDLSGQVVVADFLSSQVGRVLKIETYNGEADNSAQMADDAHWVEVFRMNFDKSPEDIQVDCDCESDCVKVYRNNQEEFFCICREEEDDDLTANKERIKQEVKAELFPVLKQQIKSEVKPEIKSELKEDESFKSAIGESLQNDEAFKNAIRDFLLGNQEFKAGVAAFLLSDEDFKKKLIEAIEKDLDPESAGQTFETETAGIYELKIRLKNGIPNRVSIPMQTLPWEEDPIILQTLIDKYSRSFVIGNWQPLNGQLVAPLS